MFIVDVDLVWFLSLSLRSLTTVPLSFPFHSSMPFLQQLHHPRATCQLDCAYLCTLYSGTFDTVPNQAHTSGTAHFMCNAVHRLAHASCSTILSTQHKPFQCAVWQCTMCTPVTCLSCHITHAQAWGAC